uniref:Mpv17-like protein 2-like n=1 Tax=Saccoglossus kowalevskii TaxID=10224 RepID=A0ABM0M4S3_SACKO
MRTTFDKLFSPKYLLFSNTLTFGGLLAFGDYIQQCRERNYIRQQHRSQRASLIASGQIHGQTAEGSRNTVTLRHDWGRTARMFSIGLVLGPFNHYWYGFLDRLLPAKTIAVVIRKILLDQTVASPFFAASYFIGMGALEGEKLERSVNVFTEKFLRVYM